MGYFAEIWTGETTEISGVTIQHNEVLDVIVVDERNQYLLTGNTIPGTWLRTCPQCWIRKNYAGKGMFYDDVNDMFIYSQPYPSWTLNIDTGKWDPPTPYPDDGKEYYWDEDTLSWVEIIPVTPTPSLTPGLSPTPTPSVTPSVSPSVPPEPSVSPIPPSASPTPGLSPTVTPTISVTPSPTPGLSPTVTPTISVTPTPSASPPHPA